LSVLPQTTHRPSPKGGVPFDLSGSKGFFMSQRITALPWGAYRTTGKTWETASVEAGMPQNFGCRDGFVVPCLDRHVHVVRDTPPFPMHMAMNAEHAGYACFGIVRQRQGRSVDVDDVRLVVNGMEPAVIMNVGAVVVAPDQDDLPVQPGQDAVQVGLRACDVAQVEHGVAWTHHGVPVCDERLVHLMI